MRDKKINKTGYLSATQSIASLVVTYLTEYGERHLVMSLMSGGDIKNRIDNIIRGAKKASHK